MQRFGSFSMLFVVTAFLSACSSSSPFTEYNGDYYNNPYYSGSANAPYGVGEEGEEQGSRRSGPRPQPYSVNQKDEAHFQNLNDRIEARQHEVQANQHHNTSAKTSDATSNDSTINHDNSDAYLPEDTAGNHSDTGN